MLYALMVSRLNAVFFLEERAGGDVGELREGVTLEIPADYASWADEQDPPDGVLCVSASDPTRYKLFRHLWDVDRSVFQALPQSFGGIYTLASWEALRAAHPALRART